MVLFTRVSWASLGFFCLLSVATAEVVPSGCFRSNQSSSDCWTPSDNQVEYDSPTSNSTQELAKLVDKYGAPLGQVIFDKYTQEAQCAADKSQLTSEVSSLTEEYNRIITGFSADYTRISANLSNALQKNHRLRAKLKRYKKK